MVAHPTFFLFEKPVHWDIGLRYNNKEEKTIKMLTLKIRLHGQINKKKNMYTDKL